MLRRLHDRLTVVRYEDLVTTPDLVQAKIAERFDLKMSRLFSQFDRNFAVGGVIAGAMNGVRSPSPASIGRWRSDARHLEHCRSVWPEIRGDTAWVCETFGYEFPADLEADLDGVQA
jgi:hypothetical protein